MSFAGTDCAREEHGRRAGSNVDCDAVIVGAGLAGLYMTYRLVKRGLSVRVFETGSGIGGTWYWNRYPGARVDSPSMQYSFSFSHALEQEWHWTECYASQPELERYAHHVADRFQLMRYVDLNTTVLSARYCESGGVWEVETDHGELARCRYLITATGCLSAPHFPEVPGLATFRGIALHTARWPAGFGSLRGQRIAVVGTGSSGIQIVPVIAEEAERLIVFQRTANYSLPSRNGPMNPAFEAEWKAQYRQHRETARASWGGSEVGVASTQSALSVTAAERMRVYEGLWGRHTELLHYFNDILTNPVANETAAEFVRGKIRETVRDQATARMLSPTGYPIGAKRICIDSNYYGTFNRPNVELVDARVSRILRIEPRGIRTSAGFYEVDLIVLATGFDAITGPLLRMNIVGRNGVRLSDKWKGGPRAFLGVATAGFPNLFTITGPGSPSVLSTMTTSIEQHVEWIDGAIGHIVDRGLGFLEASRAYENAWTAHVGNVASGTLYMRTPSWYVGGNVVGKPRVFMPYAGGVGQFGALCAFVAESGYRGFLTNAL